MFQYYNIVKVHVIMKIQLVTCSFLSHPCHFPKEQALQTEGFQNRSAVTALELCSVRGLVLKGLSICSAAYCNKHLKKLQFPEMKDK